MTATYVLYHADCMDGWIAAWAAHARFGDEDTYYLPVNYGQPVPEEIADGSRVFVLDFAWPRAELLKLHARSLTLVVLDHHKTARADLEGLHFARFAADESGASMTWMFLHPDAPEPPIVAFAKDRDLWTWKLDHSREVSAWLASYPKEFALFNLLAHRLDVQDADVLTEGTAILRAQRQRVERAAAHATLRAWRLDATGALDTEVPVLNATTDISEIGAALCARFPESPFSATYFDQGATRIWSLRSAAGGIDVSEVAKARGGGGHAAAAGFHESILPAGPK